MEKREVDRIIRDYVKPLYGFALNKTGRIAEAEELASRIVLEVYRSLLRKPDVHDLGRYVFKIAHYTWARYAGEKGKAANCVPLDDHGGAMADPDEGYEGILRQETAGELRREIAFLSRQQRDIVIKYYYGGMTIGEIAASTGLSGGTVKWHLFEAKKELKANMNAIRSIGPLGLNPIRMASLGHSGTPGSKGDTADFLSTSIRQNIVYAAYHKPRTAREIAGELGISPVFLEDEIGMLEEYGFLDRLPGGKYRANMYIVDPTREKIEALHDLYREYAALAVEQYFGRFFKMEAAWRETGVHMPGGDLNLFLWSVIPYAGFRLRFPELEKVRHDELAVPRKDGGNYIAFGLIHREFETRFDARQYYFCGDMDRKSDDRSIEAWQVDTYWCGREGGWRDNLLSDYVSLAHVIGGRLPQNEANVDVYRRLFEKQYLLKSGDGFEVNIVFCPDRQTGERLRAAIPAPPDAIREAAAKLDRDVFRLMAEGQPEHAHKYVRYWSQNSMASGEIRVHVLKHLVDAGLLKMPDPARRKGLHTILFINR